MVRASAKTDCVVIAQDFQNLVRSAYPFVFEAYQGRRQLCKRVCEIPKRQVRRCDLLLLRSICREA